MGTMNRRAFLKYVGGASALGLVGLPVAAFAVRPKARVVVIGGGYGGAIAAKYMRMADPSIRVLLIEKQSRFVSCALSNEVLGGERDMASLTFRYHGLNARGVDIMEDEIVEIDPVKRLTIGRGGNQYRYDKLVVAPGIDLRWDAIEGYDEAASERLPHAWHAGKQTSLLRNQIRAMSDGGTVIIVAPPNPFRCPPGPYERASQIASYLKRHKPRSKVLILDPKDKFAKKDLFQQGWEQHYPGMIEWVSGAAGGTVESVDPATKTAIGQVEEYQGDVVNVIPPQEAGAIAQRAGLADGSGWCPVDQRSFESTIHRDIHVIGDACIAGAMPKSGYAANSQGKACAAAIVAAVNGDSIPEPSFINTCYSMIAPGHAISAAAVYQFSDGKIVRVTATGAGGQSPIDASARMRAVEAQHAYSWFRNITADMFA